MRVLKCLLVLVLWFCTTLAAQAAEAISPPDGATVVGAPARVTFRWPAPKAPCLLEIFSGGRPIQSVSATNGTATLDLVPGPLYQWRVRTANARVPDVVPERRLVVDGDLRFSFDGAAGGPGGRGADGEDVKVSLKREGDFVRITIASFKVNRSFLMLPSSMPLQFTVRGGSGGAGVAGKDGADGAIWYPSGNTGTYLPPPSSLDGLPGERGGPGGDGGNGGDVSVDTNGDRALAEYVQVNCKGGAPGRGGAGGRGGRAGTVGNQGANPYGPGYGYGYGYQPGRPGADGADGPPGAPGLEGTVTIR